MSIKKLNGILWANVKKVNGIAVANINKINGIEAGGTVLTNVYPSDDAFCRSSSVNNNWGDADYIQLGGWADVYLAGLKFDISLMPSNVSSAKVYLYRIAVGSGSSLSSTKWNRIEEDWSEDTLTYSNRPDGMVNNTGTSVNIPSVGNWLEIDITTLYNQWKAGTYNNYGIALTGNSSSYNNIYARFATKEYTTDTSKKPYLEVVV
jgi:hypothetical protein